ncbi:MAG: hypothetical protein A3G93_07120 [Nitrospinae bacterium RIFCSPLOWO2_12_FULL_45_22]|nr:MAG: hypothetical protein A3G93_07120 [Nitrospinae bacterium RIFCSPLOWO2_12_FULL_45_22]
MARLKTTRVVLGLFLLPLTFFFSEAFAEYGDPTAEEQYMLELINRARANPAEEGQRFAYTNDTDVQNAINYFAVNISTMIAEFNSYPTHPPLTFDKRLIDMARFHSDDMLKYNYQGHTGSGGDTLTDRLKLFGYDYSSAAENVYAYAKSLFYGHAGFMVDWGVPDLGHRKNLLEFTKTGSIHKEIGIGIVHTVTSSTFKNLLKFQPPGIFLQATVGPIIITENFALSRSMTQGPSLLGVIYDDKNGNNFYDIGEGLKGVTVESDNGQSTTTSTSGGYSMEITSPGSYIVKATGGGLSYPLTKTVEIADKNVKVDFLASESQANTLLSLSLSKSAYLVGEAVTLYVSVYPGIDIESADVYLVLVYPDISFRSVTDIDGSLGEQNKAVALAKSWPVTAVSAYPLFQKTFQLTDQKGKYQLFLILVKPGADPLNIFNWLTYKDVSFSLQ